MILSEGGCCSGTCLALPKGVFDIVIGSPYSREELGCALMLSIKMIAFDNTSIPNLLVGTYFLPMPKLRPIFIWCHISFANIACMPLLYKLTGSTPRSQHSKLLKAKVESIFSNWFTWYHTCFSSWWYWYLAWHNNSLLAQHEECLCLYTIVVYVCKCIPSSFSKYWHAHNVFFNHS